MDQVEASGRTVDDALNTALRQLGCTIDDVEFTVLDEGRRGFLGRGARDAVVRVVRISPAPATTTAGQPAASRPQRGPRPDRGPRPAGESSGSRERGGRGGRDRDRGPRGGGRPGRRPLEASSPELTEADFLRGRQSGDAPAGETSDRPVATREPRGDRSGPPRESRNRGRADQPRRQREPDEPQVEPNIDAEEVDIAATIVDDILRILDIDAEINLREPLTPGDGRGSALAVIDIGGEDLGVLIGRRGDTLSSLQYLVNLALIRRYPGTPGITIDIEHYRHRREEQLSTLAQRMADRVRENGSPITLEPMPPAERRLIHLALAEDPDVETASIGDGDSRKVVISPRRH
jgi:spoIIIJ-associated protein